MPAVMLQGTGSDAGKSVLTAGLCRLFTNRGLRVRPFKPQNMSNNAAVAADGGEIGRAQALQAIACRTPPSVDMNPVLIKPQSDRTAQLVVQGRVRGTMGTDYYRQQKQSLMQAVMESYSRLRAEADLVIVEGAGSPAEINLRAGDIANMGKTTSRRRTTAPTKSDSPWPRRHSRSSPCSCRLDSCTALQDSGSSHSH